MVLRTKFAMMALDGSSVSVNSRLALMAFLLHGGDVGLFDATNSNIERRSYIALRCAYAGFRVLFLESICDDEELVQKNCEMKLNSPGTLGFCT